MEHSVPRNFVAQSDFVNRLIIIVEHKMGVPWNTCGTLLNKKVMLRIMAQKGLKPPFFAHFVEHCAKCSTGNNPRK